MLLGTLLSSLALAAPRTALRVAPYPYVPDPVALFAELEGPFEAANPDVDLQLVWPDAAAPVEAVDRWAADLYAPGAVEALLRAPQGVRPDVIELDAVLLADLVQPDDGPPLLQSLALPDDRSWVPGTAQAMVLDGQTWAVPHWVCANFVFHTDATPGVTDATTFSELALAVDDGGLLVGFASPLWLGEWYLTALLDHDASALDALARPTDPRVARELRALLSACPGGACRDAALYTASPGYPTRQLLLGRVAAAIGYAESLHPALEASAIACPDGRGTCRSVDDLRVSPLPVQEGGARVGWVDGLAVRAGVRGRTRDAAERFVAWATSEAAYDRVLTPEWPQPPRYLLPATTGWSAGWGPLYPSLELAFGERVFPSGGNAALRRHGAALDAMLGEGADP